MTQPTHADAGLRVEVIDTLERLRELRDEWEHLHDLQQHKPLSLTYDWTICWWTSFAADKVLHILFVYEGETLLAIAPLMRERMHYRTIPLTVCRLMSNGKSPYSDVLVHPDADPDKISRIFESLIDACSENVLIFSKIPETSPVLRFIDQSPGLRHGTKPTLVTPLIKFDRPWNELLGSRSRNFRKRLKNKFNRLDRVSGISIDHEVVVTDTHPACNEILEISRNSWKQKIHRDIASDTEEKNFLCGLINQFGRQGQVHIWILRIGATPIAYELHIAYDRTSYPLRADFDERYRDLSPGSILEYTVLKHFSETQSVDICDTCADDYMYLNNWTDLKRQQFDIEIFPEKPGYCALHMLEYRLVPVLRKIRKLVTGSR